MGNIRGNNSRPEWHIQQDLIAFLTDRGWWVEPTHGNAYQTGFPDLYMLHPQWGQRWVDCKVAGRYRFTQAQKIKWPQWEKYGAQIWILTAASQDQYDKLFGPPNWRDFWKSSWGDLPDIDQLLDELNRDRKPESDA